MMRSELPDKRVRGRPERRFMDVVTEDMKLVGVREEDAENIHTKGTKSEGNVGDG